ncbi:MAG: hypothetical protein QXH37_07130 [Candidatus Bathyarchaeia archaeon]
MDKKYALLIEIPKKDVKEELGLFYKVAEKWGERLVWTYLVKHPDKIEPDLELLGVGELYHPPLKKGQFHNLDLLFRRGNIYYPVEVKYDKLNWNQLYQEVTCFEQALINERIQFDEIVPVLVVCREKGYNKQKFHWPEWWLGPLR